jgi:hypothetical protein
MKENKLAIDFDMLEIKLRFMSSNPKITLSFSLILSINLIIYDCAPFNYFTHTHTNSFTRRKINCKTFAFECKTFHNCFACLLTVASEDVEESSMNLKQTRILDKNRFKFCIVCEDINTSLLLSILTSFPFK